MLHRYNILSNVFFRTQLNTHVCISCRVQDHQPHNKLSKTSAAHLLSDSKTVAAQLLRSTPDVPQEVTPGDKQCALKIFSYLERSVALGAVPGRI